MADKPVAARVCPAGMPDPSLQGCTHGVPNGKGLVCLTVRAISYPLNGDPDETMIMAGFHLWMSLEAVLKTAALAIAALRGGSQSSRRRAPCSAVARDIFKTTS
jgi:hypothetical protein